MACARSSRDHGVVSWLISKLLFTAILLLGQTDGYPTGPLIIPRDENECEGLCRHYLSCTIALSVVLGLFGLVVLATLVIRCCCFGIDLYMGDE